MYFFSRNAAFQPDRFPDLIPSIDTKPKRTGTTKKAEHRGTNEE